MRNRLEARGMPLSGAAAQFVVGKMENWRLHSVHVQQTVSFVRTEETPRLKDPTLKCRGPLPLMEGKLSYALGPRKEPVHAI